MNECELGLLGKTKNLRTVTALFATRKHQRIKKHKELKKHKTPRSPHGAFRAFRAFRAILFLLSEVDPCRVDGSNSSDGAVTAVDFPVRAGNVTGSFAAEVGHQLCDFLHRGESLNQVFAE